MDFIFFGFIADIERLDSALSKEAAPQISAIKFQKALLQGLSERADVRIVATLPIASFPRNKHLVTDSGRINFEWPSVEGYLLPMVNLPLIKLAFRFFGGIIVGWRLCRHKKSDAILVYATHTPFVAAASFLSSIFGIPFAVFIPDLPLHMRRQKERGSRGILKRLDNKILQHLIHKAAVTFPITVDVAKDWLPPNAKYTVIEGIAPTLHDTSIHEPSDGRKRLLYTGTLSQVSQFARMFSESPELDAECIFIGGGPEFEELKAIATADPRVIVKPFMAEPELRKEFQAADILLNPRYTAWDGARYSFPSKLMDYMARGLPIISTRLAGIPPEYFNVFFGTAYRHLCKSR